MAKNARFFSNVDSEEKAYWLGFYYADGGMWKNLKQISIQLSLSDIDHLQKFADIFGLTVKTGSNNDKRTGNTYHHCRCIVSSKQVCDDLLTLGIDRVKSYDDGLVLDKIPKHLIKHFIRGLFDGDGSIGRYGQGNKSSDRATFTGTHGIINKIANILCQQTGINRNKTQRRDTISAISWSGFWNLSRIKEYLYDESTVFLERKKEKFDAIKPKSGSSQYQGVHWCNTRRKWIARIYRNNKQITIGQFNSEIDAKEAYGIHKIYLDIKDTCAKKEIEVQFRHSRTEYHL